LTVRCLPASCPVCGHVVLLADGCPGRCCPPLRMKTNDVVDEHEESGWDIRVAHGPGSR
jgi:hypothetical protein